MESTFTSFRRPSPSKAKPEPIEDGGVISREELMKVARSMTGRPILRITNVQAFADALSKSNPQRFKHEVDRCRGLAFNLAPDGTCV